MESGELGRVCLGACAWGSVRGPVCVVEGAGGGVGGWGIVGEEAWESE